MKHTVPDWPWATERQKWGSSLPDRSSTHRVKVRNMLRVTLTEMERRLDGRLHEEGSGSPDG